MLPHVRAPNQPSLMPFPIIHINSSCPFYPPKDFEVKHALMFCMQCAWSVQPIHEIAMRRRQEADAVPFDHYLQRDTQRRLRHGWAAFAVANRRSRAAISRRQRDDGASPWLPKAPAVLLAAVQARCQRRQARRRLACNPHRSEENLRRIGHRFRVRLSIQLGYFR